MTNLFLEHNERITLHSEAQVSGVNVLQSEVSTKVNSRHGRFGQWSGKNYTLNGYFPNFLDIYRNRVGEILMTSS